MKSRTITVRALLKEGLFEIPWFQRSYAWEEQQLNDFWDDLVYLPEGKTHFFGNVVLKRGEPFKRGRLERIERYDVIDGQQRLTTILLFLRAACNKDSSIEPAVEDLLYPLPGVPRLRPMDQDKDFFENQILRSHPFPDPATPSQKRLKEALSLLEQQAGAEADMVDLTGDLLDSFQVNLIDVEDESEVAAMFESINDRGKSLTTLEKTKSFLLHMDSLATDAETSCSEDIKSEFGEMYKALFVLEDGHETASGFEEDDIQRYHWGMYDGYDSDEYYRSFRTLRGRLRDHYREGALTKVRKELQSYPADLRQATEAVDSLFRLEKQDPEVVREMEPLLELQLVANVLPVLMAAQIRFKSSPAAVARAAKLCEKLVFRMYVIGRRRTDTGRSRLVTLSYDIHRGQHTPDSMGRRLREIIWRYADDKRFEEDLRDWNLCNRVSSRGLKYLLFHYMKKLTRESKERIPYELGKILSEDFQVEHILARQLDPRHIPEELRDTFEENRDRLGNLTLIAKSWNPEFGKLPFAKKRVPTGKRKHSYRTSGLLVQSELAELERFGKEELDARQDTLVDFALRRWRIKAPLPKGE